MFCNVVGKETEEETSNKEGRKVMAGSKRNMKDAKKTVSRVAVFQAQGLFRTDPAFIRGMRMVFTLYKKMYDTIQRLHFLGNEFSRIAL